MTQIPRHPAYLLIEDHLDAIAQKYRILRILRGALLFTAASALSTFAAALAAHFAGQGRLSSLLLILWLLSLAAGALAWLILPLLLRPRPLHMAHLAETRIPNLHNGLSNSVLLARAADLQQSPWLGPIFDEILTTIRSQPLAQAITLRDLRPLFLRTLLLLAQLATLTAFPAIRYTLLHGFRQMLTPAQFVPKAGRVQILEISPRQITLVTGQPLEITVLAEDPDHGTPAAHLVFDNPDLPRADLPAAPTPENQLRYTYRLEHAEQSTRFRVEIAGTESEWCMVNVVKQVKLKELILNITPPQYTRQSPQTLVLKGDQVDKTPLAVFEGSRLELSILADVPVRSALLQLDQETPAPMEVAQAGQRFTGSAIIMRSLELAALPTEAGQVIAKLPDPSLRVGCTKDIAPTIEMQWPAQDLAVAPKSELKLQALLKDDHGLSTARILMSTNPDQPLSPVYERPYSEGITTDHLAFVLKLPDDQRVHGRSIRVQVETTDNRNLATLVNAGLGAPASAKDTGPQTTSSPIYEIKFRDPDEIAREQKEQFDKLRQILLDMLRKQQSLLALAEAWKPTAKTMPQINAGQVGLRTTLQQTAESFPFDPDDRIVQKTLLVLYQNPAREAVDLSQAIQTEPVEKEKLKLNSNLQAKQRQIIDILETLLTKLQTPTIPTTQPGRRGGDLDNDKEKYKDLQDALKKFMAEERRILDATASLAKKPVDNFDDKDKKLLEDLKMAQEKMDAFMHEKISDFSKLAEQDMANASLLKEMLEVYSEVTMAKDALKKNAIEMAIPLEEMGLELAKEISSNLEKWLMNEPDRIKWNQEDPIGKTDVPMAELPKELEDMVGELMEQQEDLFEEMEDTAANWADSLDKGAGWDAADGPIANMSAKGVTGNQLPNNNEMNGRSGEGRSGRSQGEFVEETASGKGGRNTPTRLDPTPFQQGQIKDQSKDPVGGATGGGKISGQGGAGLEGHVPNRDLKDKMERLAGKQAELRNKAERLELDRKAAPYDNFKLMEAIALMRRVESDLHSNRYQTALRRKDVLVERLDTSRLLLDSQLHLQRDTSPTMSRKMEDQIHDVTAGQLPPAWSEALKEYYKKLSQQ